MNTTSKLALAVALLLSAAGPLVLSASVGREPSEAERAAPSVRALVLARPFTLERPASHLWRAEPADYDAGWLVVLEIDPAFTTPRQSFEPVLQAGLETVERVNHGQGSGRVVGIVPSARGADGRPTLDLSRTVFFHGPEELPERLSEAELQRALARAAANGARPFAVDQVATAIERGGELVALPSRDELDLIVGLLVLEYAPEEVDLGTGLLAPRVR
ncbi:MAG: hypothetical protein JNK02_11420 [Planctomycetes bacterium]|nr:hypothetical protein [Planctomycetota bacterium]